MFYSTSIDTHPKTNMVMENHHFEQEIRLQTGRFFHCHVSFPGCIFKPRALMVMLMGSIPHYRLKDETLQEGFLLLMVQKSGVHQLIW